MKASIVVRTYNEERHLSELLSGIAGQQADGIDHETLIVDSGSTDRTLDIAKSHGCRILHIRKEEFSFGRSLNIGCGASGGNVLVFVSGHCIPASEHWLAQLVRPIADGVVSMAYGRQIGGPASRFSECRIFEKYFPAASSIPQEGFFFNNANSALRRSVWQNTPFDEDLTGLEDMHLAKTLVASGHKVGYVAEAVVFHLHYESWAQVRNRFERESIALQHIMPEIHLGYADFLRYLCSAILHDCGDALQKKRLLSAISEIGMYRLMQYWGAFRGNRSHRQLSKGRKERYFYPR